MESTTASQGAPTWEKRAGGDVFTFRPMHRDDKREMLKLARSLPEDDLLFLVVDITQEDAVDEWIRRLEDGQIHTIVVEKEGKLVGHGSLVCEQQVWTRHLGGMVLLLAPEYRGKGLGQELASELFSKAGEIGLRKVVARMASEQKGAVSVFKKLGFRMEALLTDCVIDRNDRTHDLIIMSYDVTGFTE